MLIGVRILISTREPAPPADTRCSDRETSAVTRTLAKTWDSMAVAKLARELLASNTYIDAADNYDNALVRA